MNKVEADGKKRVVDDATYWQVADKSLRHERLQDVIRTVKCHVDLMLNNQFDALINQEIGGEEFEEADHRSCPDLHPDKEAIFPDPEDFRKLNESFPGLNQEIDPVEKRIELMQFFEKQAERDAIAERDFQNAVMREKLKQDQECMYDNELIDNCFFASRAKADNMAQTIREMHDKSVDIQSIEKTVREAMQSRQSSPELMPAQGGGRAGSQGREMARTTLD